jgi:hypothetical protein
MLLYLKENNYTQASNCKVMNKCIGNEPTRASDDTRYITEVQLHTNNYIFTMVSPHLMVHEIAPNGQIHP